MNNHVDPLFQGIISIVESQIDHTSYCPICKSGDQYSHKIEVCKFCQEKLTIKEKEDGLIKTT